MDFDFSNMDETQAYRLLVQTVIPRPIAWVLSRNENGAEFNLAPFSYFNMVNAEPPTFVMSVSKKDDGTYKDTARNLSRGGDFVIHVPHAGMAELVTKSSAALAYGVSELDALGLKLCYDLPETDMPRLLGARIAFVCVLEKSFAFGDDEHTLFVIRGKRAYIDDKIVSVSDGGRIDIDARRVDPLGRLGGSDYLTLKGIVSVPRP